MKRLGIYLGFHPEGGGAFQYAQSVLAAMAALPADEYEIVAAHAHPAWRDILSERAPHIRLLAVREGWIDAGARLALRLGFPLRLWHVLARRFHQLSRILLAQDCVAWVFPAQDYLTYALPARTIGAIHDLMHRHEPAFPEVSSRGLGRRRDFHYRNLCAHAAGILVDSRIGKDHVIEAYPVSADHVHVLPYIAPAYIRGGDPKDFAQRHALPERYLFYPAQFWAHKNHVRLLEAFARVRDEIRETHLVLAGSRKNAYADVLRAIERLDLRDRVRLLGYVPDQDMPALYRRATALIMPTFFGPTNIPPLEAMAVGCPMAVSDIYAMPDQVGEAAIRFDPGSTQQIAEAIVRLATDADLRKRLASAGRKRDATWSQPQFDARFAEIVRTVLVQT